MRELGNAFWVRPWEYVRSVWVCGVIETVTIGVFQGYPRPTCVPDAPDE